MKIFISWSGAQSEVIAKGLKDWLPKVLQSVETFFSPDIEKGTKGGAEINAALDGTNVGIICLTPENRDSTWIHYEAGALAKTSDPKTRVWTLLQDLNPSDVEQPLAQFQHTLANRDDIFKLLRSINGLLDRPLESEPLQETFEMWWPILDETLSKAQRSAKPGVAGASAGAIRPDREVLDEILEILRKQSRTVERQLAQRAKEPVIRSYSYWIGADSNDGKILEEIRSTVADVVRTYLPTRGTSFELDNYDGSVVVKITVDPPLPESHLEAFSKHLQVAVHPFFVSGE
jgi:hypothetical protein